MEQYEKEMKCIQNHLDFVRYCIDEQQCIPSIKDWDALFLFMQQQALLGVGFRGLARMKEAGADVPRDVVLKWYAISEQIRQANEKTNRVAVDLTEQLWQEGFRTCILKGQGNTLNYPDQYIRTSGDIDIWVKPVDSGQSTVDNYLRNVLLYARKKNPKVKACYHHVDAGIYKGVEVEVHYRPSFMNNLIHNRRLQQWCKEQAEEQFVHKVELPDKIGSIYVPTHYFNCIYQISHIYNHVIHEGVGLRQLVDYYYLLRKAKDDVKCEMGNVKETLQYLGLYKFAGAVMWVLKEKLGLEEQYLIVQPNEKLGRFLLDEIMQGGNFGQYDTRVKHGGSQLSKNIQRLKRDLRLMWYFPSECLWEPIFRVYHFFWRVLVKLRECNGYWL